MDRAVLLARLGKTRDALKEMLDCVKVAPHDAEVQYRLALILLEAGQRPAAETALRRAVRNNPQHTAARETLSRLLNSNP